MQDLVRPGRTTSIALRLDRFTLERLKALAALRNTGYQTLLKEFVVERLYEEEKRAGIVER
jgi:predicted DNA binding CopG/RHH family protein